MFDATVWSSLNPHLSIEEKKPLKAEKTHSLSKQEKKRQISSLKEDGYCYIPSVLCPQKIDQMKTCVNLLVEKKIPPVFSFVYDIFWEPLLEIDPILRTFLNDEYLIIPNAWTWVVHQKSKSYFPPHRDLDKGDFMDEEKMPTLFSLWIPLTDVSTFNSCMHVLPGSLDPDYPEKALNWRERWREKGHSPWKVEDLVNIRALPAPKGSILGWNAGVMHWGSKPHLQAEPRISIGYYLHSKKAKTKHPYPVDFSKPFPLQNRLAIILDMLRIYGQTLEKA